MYVYNTQHPTQLKSSLVQLLIQKYYLNAKYLAARHFCGTSVVIEKKVLSFSKHLHSIQYCDTQQNYGRVA